MRSSSFQRRSAMKRAPVGRNTIDRERLRSASCSTQIKLIVTATPKRRDTRIGRQASIPQRFPSPMIPAARAAAAIEVLTDIDARRRPAADAMKDWGLAHRFAGSGDRAAISASSMTRCAGKARPPGSWETRVRAPKCWAR